jgi:hypothetical protein
MVTILAGALAESSSTRIPRPRYSSRRRRRRASDSVSLPDFGAATSTGGRSASPASSRTARGRNDAAEKVAGVLFPTSGSKTVAASEKRSEAEAEVLDLVGGPCRIRTGDQLVKSQLLYRLS